MGLLGRLRRGWSLVGVARPWPEGPSIHAHLASHTHDGVLDPAGLVLPSNEEGGLQWAPGAVDGILAHHASETGDETRLAAMLAALLALFREATATNLSAVYTQCEAGPVAGLVDDLADALNDTPGLDAARVHALGKVLALEATHLEATKLGITLLGLVENDDREILLQLGLHDELSMFAALALVKQIEDAEAPLFALAQHVHGWGRIHVVERLADTTSPEIKAWLLREGFRNTVMDEYLAHTCATAGELHLALAAPDAALLRGAAGIFRALAAGGPAADLADYEHAAAAIDAWLPLVTPTLPELVALDALVQRPEISAGQRTRIEVLRGSVVALTAIEAGLQSSDSIVFGLADGAARLRKLSTFAQHEARARSALPAEATYSIVRLLQEATPDTLERALVAAASAAPATSHFEAEHRLSFVLSELARFAPGRGHTFVLAGLRGAWAEARALAAQLLSRWPAPWPEELREALADAAEDETDDEMKAALGRVLAGRPYADAAPPKLH